MSLTPHTGHVSAADMGALGPELHGEKAPRRVGVSGREAQLRQPRTEGGPLSDRLCSRRFRACPRTTRKARS